MEEASLFAGRPEDTNAICGGKAEGFITCLSYNTQYGGNRFMVAIPNSLTVPTMTLIEVVACAFRTHPQVS
ncbi:MAG: hypothetical protein R3B54_18540 [Bdellovibrionota bacterium]